MRAYIRKGLVTRGALNAKDPGPSPCCCCCSDCSAAVPHLLRGVIQHQQLGAPRRAGYSAPISFSLYLVA